MDRGGGVVGFRGRAFLARAPEEPSLLVRAKNDTRRSPGVEKHFAHFFLFIFSHFLKGFVSASFELMYFGH